MKKFRDPLILTVAFVLIVVVLTGCGSKESPSLQAPAEASGVAAFPSGPAETGAARDEEPAAPAPSSGPTEVPPAEVTASPAQPADEAPAVPQTTSDEGDPFELFSESIQALRSLSSYSYATMMKYEGVGELGGESGVTEIIGEYSAPDRYHLTVIDSPDGARSEFVKIGDGLWVYEDGEWSKVPEMAAAAVSQGIFTFALDYIWGTLVAGLKTDADFVGRETVNGVKTLHYSSTDSSWENGLGAGFGGAHGDIWIAEAGYPVRFVFTASGTDAEGNSGSIEWRTEVTNVNGDISIEPPR